MLSLYGFYTMVFRNIIIVYAIIWNNLILTDAALAETFKKCCDMGTNWAEADLSCNSYPSPIPGVGADEQTICLTSIKICCAQKLRNNQCSAGEDAARAGKSCTATQSKPAGDSFKDCCEACMIGLITGSAAQQCDPDAFGSPLNLSFLKCCEEKTTTVKPISSSTTPVISTTQSSSTTETTQATKSTPTESQSTVPTTAVLSTTKRNRTPPVPSERRSMCHLIGDALCAHKCVPLPSSYKCECRKGYILMADGKSCRHAPNSSPDRCQAANPCEQICTDNGVAIICSCDKGLKLGDDKRICEDVDECTEQVDDCDDTEICVNEHGSYRCIPQDDTNEITDAEFDDDLKCPEGYKYNKKQKTCDDINECDLAIDKCDRNVQFCVNTVGNYTCISRTDESTCPAGFKVNGFGLCEDLDECKENRDICSEVEICVNENGGYRCINKEPDATTKPIKSKTTTALPISSSVSSVVCSTGFAYSYMRRTCDDIDECSMDERACDSTQNCINTMGSFRCECKIGFQLDVVTGACTDINECQQGNHQCSVQSQRCDNTIGSYQCVRFTSCGTGYTLNAASGLCEDDDECGLGIHDCNVLGDDFQCRNTLGSFRCEKKFTYTTKCYTSNCYSTVTKAQIAPTLIYQPPKDTRPAQPTGTNVYVKSCLPGFYSNGFGECIDIDECATSNPCQKHQQCLNTGGSFRCIDLIACKPGFKISNDGRFCEDIDECETGTHKCTEQQHCINRDGGHICQCPLGYKLDQNKKCEDINECEFYRGQHVCGRNAECENTQGSYHCRCKEGFKDINNMCQDVNECSEVPNLCQHTCVNVWGGYRCVCNSGFILASDNRTCTDVDECEQFKDKQLCIGICENTPGSYVCKCPEGYRLGQDKRSCQDIDECEKGNICQRPTDICLNVRGSYKCNSIQCPPNYIQDPEQKSRCKRTIDYCQSRDEECIRTPSTYSHNFITFVSKLPLPQTNRLDLFTMRGPRWDTTTVTFNMELVNARCPRGIAKANKDFFRMYRTNYNEAVLSLVKMIEGPQEVELQLTMEVYQNGIFKGSAAAKVFIVISQYEF